MTPNAKACLIDDGGRLWDVPPHRATAAAQRDLRVETARCIRMYARNQTITIVVAPQAVSPVAISRMVEVLHNRAQRTPGQPVFCLSLLKPSDAAPAAVELYRCVKHVVNRLVFLAREADTRDDQRFIRRNLSSSQTVENSSSARLLAEWRRDNGNYRPDVFVPVLRTETAGRYWIHEKIPHRRSFAITEAGPSLRIPDPNYTTQLRGTDIAALPDAGYGRWVLQDFMRAAQPGQPTYDEISAHMFWPETGVIERRYRRLLLPWLNAKGRVVLTSAITSL